MTKPPKITTQATNMTHHARSLRRILDEAQQLQSTTSLAVFDLDSTLFDVKARLEKVLMNFANEPEYQTRFPEQIKYFKNIQILKQDWGIKNVLIRAGLEGHHHQFQNTVRDYWIKHFFSNELLVHDTPYAGAVEFVQNIAQTATEVVYLTGRDVHRMGQGSKKSLVDWGFPLDEMKQRLVLKPQKEMDDALFKRDWFKNLEKNKYSKIWFFENEPVNINLIRKVCPDVEIVFFDSTHSGVDEAPDDIPRILHFLLDDSEEKI